VMNFCHVFRTATLWRYVRRDESTPMAKNGVSNVTPEAATVASMSGRGVSVRAFGGQCGNASAEGAARVRTCAGST
jgi:hypothetical protein